MDNEDFDDDGLNEIPFDGEKFNKISNLLNNMFGFPPLKNDDVDDEELDSTPTDTPTNIETIIEGDWRIVIKTWARGNGLVTEKVEILGPTNDIPQVVKDIIKNRLRPKNSSMFKISASDNAKKFVDELVNINNSNNDDVNIPNNIAKFWFNNMEPDFDKLIQNSLLIEDYEEASVLRDKKKNLDILKKVVLEKLQKAIDECDFIAIDTIIASYKAKLPKYIK